MKNDLRFLKVDIDVKEEIPKVLIHGIELSFPCALVMLLVIVQQLFQLLMLMTLHKLLNDVEWHHKLQPSLSGCLALLIGDQLCEADISKDIELFELYQGIKNMLESMIRVLN